MQPGTAIAVIGANYGDEGKGLMTNWLCQEHHPDFVVRFNGGAQAGHTVELADGTRHVFSHIGAGALAGVSTYLSSFFVMNPSIFRKEWEELSTKIPKIPDIFSSSVCKVTTPFDEILNQFKEISRGNDRHGSVGVGFSETISRCEVGRGTYFRQSPESYEGSLVISLRTGDYFSRELRQFGVNNRSTPSRKPYLLTEEKYNLLQDLFFNWEPIVEKAVEDFKFLKERIDPLPHIRKSTFGDKPRLVFEGAQGLLLDQNHPNFPYVTRSNTGLKNVKTFCANFGISLNEAIYMTRTYLTRHGAGPLDNEGQYKGQVIDPTNVPNPYQGSLRTAPLNIFDLMKRIKADFGNSGCQLSLGVTHVNERVDRIFRELPADLDHVYISNSPLGVASINSANLV